MEEHNTAMDIYRQVSQYTLEGCNKYNTWREMRDFRRRIRASDEAFARQIGRGTALDYEEVLDIVAEKKGGDWRSSDARRNEMEAIVTSQEMKDIEKKLKRELAMKK